MLRTFAICLVSALALLQPAAGDHHGRHCVTLGAHEYCLVLAPFVKVGDVAEPVDVAEPILTVNAQRWRMELHATTLPGDPDASFPVALAAVNGQPAPKEFNLSAEAAGQRMHTTAAFHASLCQPWCAVAPGVEPGVKIGELWLSYAQITEDGFVIASTPPLPVLHVERGTPTRDVVGAPDPAFFT